MGSIQFPAGNFEGLEQGMKAQGWKWSRLSSSKFTETLRVVGLGGAVSTENLVIFRVERTVNLPEGNVQR